MIAVVAADRAGDALDFLAARDVPAWRLGDVRTGDGASAAVRLVNDYLGRAATWR